MAQKRRKTDSVYAHEVGRKKLKDAIATKHNYNGEIWTYLDVAQKAGLRGDKTVQRFFAGEKVKRKSATAICQALGLDIDEIVEEKKVEEKKAEERKAEPKPATSQDWRKICQTMLDRRVSSNLLTGKQGVSFSDVDSIYVYLALVERRKQEKHQGGILAPEGSSLYHSREYEEKQRFEHQQFLRQILGEGKGKTQGKRVAIIGEPGAGKTTTLQKIADWLLSENQISENQIEIEDDLPIPIWVSLADLAAQDLGDYLSQTWLKQAIGKFQVTSEVQQNFCQQIKQGRFWLLLDGLDEMPVGNQAVTAQEKIHRQLQGWMSSVRVVVSCRVNLWEADLNALADFETYRMLDFDHEGQASFIHKFFHQQQNPGQAEKLQAQLNKPEYKRLRDLVKNPLRLTLLCTIWQSSQGKLPETQAELYCFHLLRIRKIAVICGNIYRGRSNYRMKLSDYAKAQGISYRTAWSWWKKGMIKGHQLPTGTILIETDANSSSSSSSCVVACIYARVSSSENKSNLDRQAERLAEYATAKGYTIHKVVKEVGSGLNDNRKKLNQLLLNRAFNVLVVEHKDRLTRFGARYIEIILESTDRRLEVVNEVANDKEDLMTDFASVITSFCARLYGMRRAKRKTEKLINELQSNGNNETC